ncbi:MAG TPA: alpha/beta hydrolase [Povalibacter sp.]|uniref:alpha/beta fold hydrolase n=1 Tax=Povalibacter sp. TaxID=1962978 RepID=UPI002C6D7453|nr:alpha/beta hydrolase [Povalibacter sp.]HMN43571.1 alpha/beta hydrolase [Povalibacter sp.]
MSELTPAWFSKAIAQPTQSRFVDVDGTAIHYLSWNAHETDKPGLLLAHGFRAHARWWSFTAPYLTDRFRVFALDFAGMGDSGSRPRYSSELFTRDIIGVLDDIGLDSVTLVGHSFGGSRVIRTCVDYPQRIGRAVVIDSFIPVPEMPRREPPPNPPRTKKTYATYEAARARFRLIPERNCSAGYVLDYVAEHSLKRTDGGWTWKFDENYEPHHADPVAEAADSAAKLQRVACPVSIIYGEHTVVMPRALARRVTKYLPQGRGPVEIPESHHHVLLDQPLSLVSALRAVLI